MTENRIIITDRLAAAGAKPSTTCTMPDGTAITVDSEAVTLRSARETIRIDRDGLTRWAK